MIETVQGFSWIILPAICFAMLVIAAALVVAPKGKNKVDKALRNINLVNGQGKIPVLYRNSGFKGVFVMKFKPLGISLQRWEDMKDSLGQELDCTITLIQYKKGSIIITARRGYNYRNKRVLRDDI